MIFSRIAEAPGIEPGNKPTLALITQTLRIMKITAILLFAACLQVSARGFAQGINLSERNAPLPRVLESLQRQTGYDFIYPRHLVQQAKPVSIEVKGAKLEEVLDKIFKEQPLSYKIFEKTIAIRAKEKETTENIQTPVEDTIPRVMITGRVQLQDSNSVALENVNVVNRNTQQGAITNANGVFSLMARKGDVLEFSFVGILTRRMTVNNVSNVLAVNLERDVKQEELVTVVSTGYQDIPKERATGSFEKISNELLNRSVSTNILDRLNGIVSSMNFDPNPNTQRGRSITIRGISTITANPRPLLVVDGFPYDESESFENVINNINPNDVESITVLKDAAAASIWGVRAGNGVIVITTKNGKLNQKLSIQFNSNVTAGAKPDQFYIPKISSAEHIELEKILFDRGFYNSTLNSLSRPLISQVIEILVKKRDGQLSASEAEVQIEELKKYDIRNEIDNYFQQVSINQQYAINISGGSSTNYYYGSVGFDKNRMNAKGDEYNRLTLRFNNTYRIIKNFEVNAFLAYAQSKNQNNSVQISGSPYIRVVDDIGNSLSIPKDYRQAYKDTANYPALLDWDYRPLEELKNNDRKAMSNDIRMGITAKYSFLKGFNAEIKYQHQKSQNNIEAFYSPETYFVRNLVNRYMSISRNDGKTIVYPVPNGAILTRTNSSINQWNFRGQLNFNRTWHSHGLVALAGAESRELSSNGGFITYYNYNSQNGTSQSRINYDSVYRLKPTGTGVVPSSGNAIPEVLSRNISYFVNSAYTYKEKYRLSTSARLDGTNFFGIKANQRITPLWSVGFSWDISKEIFFKIPWISFLKLRSTYGFNGNMFNSATAYPTISIVNSSSQSLINSPYAILQSTGNPELRWEKVGLLNFGIDFKNYNSRLGGSIEFYSKKGKDLIGPITIDYTTGIDSYIGNRANIKGKGIDVTLNAIIIDKIIKWQTDFLFSYNTNKVTEYSRPAKTNSDYIINGTPIIGKPLFSLYSYDWAGLDPNNGDPRAYVSDTIANYNTAYLNATPDDLIYHGSPIPTIFGSFRNSISLGQFSVSINLIYKLGYYFRRTSVNYGNAAFTAYSSGGHSDYSLRWQKSGDEKITKVPSLPNSFNDNRDKIYQYSSILVEKGDHIRVQDVRVSYNLKRFISKKQLIQNATIYAYANNLGILWRANKHSIDPDFGDQSIPYSRSITIGLTANF